MRIIQIFGLLLSFGTQWSHASEPFGIAVFDGPVDYLHPEISPYLDLHELKATQFRLYSGRKISLWDFNQEAIQWELGRISSPLIPSLERVFEVPFESGSYPRTRAVINMLVNGGYALFHLRDLHVLGDLYHSTHVTGTILKVRPNAKVYPIAFLLGDPSNGICVQPQEKGPFNLAQCREEVKRFFGTLSELFTRNRIRIANLSIYLGVVDELGDSASARLFRMVGSIVRDAFRDLVKSHQETVFVVAAGNNSRDVSLSLTDFATLYEPNVLVVAATDEKGRIAKFSNYSKEIVDLAARGKNVLGPKFGGGKIHMSGTSMAAPTVAGQIAEIMTESPNLSTEKVLEKLFKQYTIEDEELRTYVKDGRILVPQGWDEG